MFVTFQKITTASPSKKKTVLVNTEDILLMDVDTFEDKEQGVLYQASRVEIVGLPSYKFHTLTPIDEVVAAIPTVDVTSGVADGSQCSVPGAMSILTPFVQYPLIRANAIFNSNPDEVSDYVFNPNHLVYSEEVIFMGPGNRQHTGLMVSLRDSQQRQILTKLSIEKLIELLEPREIS